MASGCQGGVSPVHESLAALDDSLADTGTTLRTIAPTHLTHLVLVLLGSRSSVCRFLVGSRIDTKCTMHMPDAAVRHALCACLLAGRRRKPPRPKRCTTSLFPVSNSSRQLFALTHTLTLSLAETFHCNLVPGPLAGPLVLPFRLAWGSNNGVRRLFCFQRSFLALPCFFLFSFVVLFLSFSLLRFARPFAPVHQSAPSPRPTERGGSGWPGLKPCCRALALTQRGASHRFSQASQQLRHNTGGTSEVPRVSCT